MEENVKQFKIEQVDEDSYKVKSLVNDNELVFKKNIELSRKIQSVNANARLNMIKWMKSEGLKKTDLIETINKNGKVIYDETVYRDIERGFIEDEAVKLSSQIFNIIFNKSIEEVMLELNITDENEGYRFGEEIRNILSNKTPSK